MKLRVLTYNVLATPQDLAQVVTGSPPDPWRFTEEALGRRLAVYDVVGLTEAFTSEARRLCEDLPFPTRLSGPAARSSAEIGSGVELFSKLPRVASRRVTRHHYGERGIAWDGFAAKGALLAWLATPVGPLVVVVTHLQSGHAPEAVRFRNRQLRELHRVVASVPRTEAALVLGDLNVDGNDPDDPGYDLCRTLFGDFQDAATLSPPAEATWSRSRNPRVQFGEHRYDFILFRSGARVALRLVRAGLAMTERVRGTTLSDHFGVEAELEVEATTAT